MPNTKRSAYKYPSANRIIAFENGELTERQVIRLFKDLYISGLLFQLQGFYGRTFQALVGAGKITEKNLK